MNRCWRLGLVGAVVLFAAVGCGGSGSGSDADGGSDAPDTVASETTTTAAGGAGGPLQIRLQGTRQSDGYSYDEEVSFVLAGPCDGAGECTLSRSDGVMGYGVPGWEVPLEVGDDGTYSYDGVETLTIDRCGDEVLTDELAATLALTVTPVDGGEPEVTVNESWAEVPEADMSDGSVCSGLSATLFVLK